MFIRKKTIKKNEYAYLVKNRWKKKGKKGIAKQKNLKYLGKVLNLGKSNFYSLKEELSDYKDIIKNILIGQLLEKGFVCEKKNVYKRSIEDEIAIVDLGKKNVFSENSFRKLVLQLNEGFLCDFTIKRLFKFRYYGEENEELGYVIADLMLSAGIRPTKEQFVAIVKNMLKQLREEKEKARKKLLD